jgi:Ca-activated chloride channel homolog
MFRFEHTEVLYALLAIPALFLLFSWMLFWRKRAMKRFGDWMVIKRLVPEMSTNRIIFKFVILMTGYAFLVIALANPQIGSKLIEGERKGIDLVIALDVSTSMLAKDIEPSRLDRSKQAISRLIDQLGNDRIGIVVFAGHAYVQLPITTDYAAAKMFLSAINTNIVPVQGTAIGAAIQLSAKSFDNETHSKAIIIITDGENHEDDPVKETKTAADQGINIFTVGMGLPEGAPIPDYDSFNRQTGFKKDRQGNTVVTRLNEGMLQQIAAAGNGIYVRANNTQVGLNKIFDEISKLEKTEFESKIFSDYESRFHYFIALSLLFLIMEILIFERKNKWLRKIKLFGN